MDYHLSAGSASGGDSEVLAVITEQHYFLDKQHSEEQEQAAEILLDRVNDLLVHLEWGYPIDPDTNSSISGSRGGAGDGGFRLPNSSTGKPNSAHKQAQAVDVYDPQDLLDSFIDDALLEDFDLYREHPSATHGWVHLSTRAPKSKKRTYIP